jgi:mRNA interferase RelE/StbE
MPEKAGKYYLLVTPRAQRSLNRLARDRGMFVRIDKRIKSLSQNPRPTGCKKLKASKHGNVYRLREGDWRILYAVEDDIIIVLILDVIRRDKAYR